MVIANFFGIGVAVDAYVLALRIPNFVRNLVGDAALSASFVPVYSALLEEGDGGEEANRLARGILGPLLAFAGLLAAAGIMAAPVLIKIFGSNFDATAAATTVRMVRIIFPMAGVMIVAAWCLGILTSHRRFYLPFVAPVFWNLAQIAGLLIGARLGWEPLIVVLAWSTLIGSIVQVAIQLPTVRRLAGSLKPGWDLASASSKRVLKNAGPAAMGQGIFQISSLTDAALAALLAEGALAGLYYAQRLALLPIALFGISVAFSSLPEMSREGAISALGSHVASGARRILYFVIPSAILLGVFGDLFVSVVYQRGAFGPNDVTVVHWILGAFSIGLVAQSLIKLFAGAYHSIGDTRTPVRYATIAVVVGIALGAGLMFWLDGRGAGPRAVAGLVLGGGVGAWLNFGLLARGLRAQGVVGWLAGIRVAAVRCLLGAVVAAAVAWPVRRLVEDAVSPNLLGRVLVLSAVLVVGGVSYLLIAGAPALRRTTTASGPSAGPPA